jgi:C1A family cysteine protease
VSDLPPEVDLTDHMSPVVDQGQLGSCTANAIASGLREYLMIKDGVSLDRLSRLFLYWHERDLEGTVSEDSGAYIRDGMRVLAEIGCAPEKDFPYDITKFTQKPSTDAEAHAGQYRIHEYHRVTSYDDLKHALADGNPVVLGVDVYESFESADAAMTGNIPLPASTEKYLGGHAILAVGYRTYSDGVERIKFRNSWGETWGAAGYGTLTKSFFDAGHVRDMWTGTGTNQATPTSFTFDTALDEIVSAGIFDSPEFWRAFKAKYDAGTLGSADFQYVFLAFQKFAAYVASHR